jgi:hypothetical protein
MVVRNSGAEGMGRGKDLAEGGKLWEPTSRRHWAASPRTAGAPASARDLAHLLEQLAIPRPAHPESLGCCLGRQLLRQYFDRYLARLPDVARPSFQHPDVDSPTEQTSSRMVTNSPEFGRGHRPREPDRVRPPRAASCATSQPGWTGLSRFCAACPRRRSAIHVDCSEWLASLPIAARSHAVHGFLSSNTSPVSGSTSTSALPRMRSSSRVRNCSPSQPASRRRLM